jgi:hypothetical protein
MTTNQIIAELIEWRKRITESDQTITDCLEPLMLSPESPLYQTIWSLQGAYTAAVSKIVGDESEWLAWYASDNDMGDRGHEACPGDGHKKRKIKTIVDLATLIQESK